LAADASTPPIVLVTHHLEEIPEHFTHALLLAGGHVFAAGPLGDVLTEARLSAAFGLALTVEHDATRGRWSATAARNTALGGSALGM
jgi:iron complex transport system ATP-binding protein